MHFFWRFFTDTTCPISKKDKDGNWYLQLIADAGTKTLTGEAKKLKSGASDAIIGALARLQVLCGRTTNRIHTEGEQEENTLDIRNFFKTQKTLQTQIAPGSSQSTSIV